MYFEKDRGQRTIRFQWHFDYYIGEAREHFTLVSEKLPLPAGWGDGFEGEGVIQGPIELQYYYKDADTPGSYTPIGTVDFRFYLKIVPASG